MAIHFTANDTRLISAAWQSLKSPPEVDYEKIASIMGMSNPRSASNAMANLRKKLAAATGPIQAAPGDGAATPKATPSKRGRTIKKEDAGDNESPTKKKKGGKKPDVVKKEVKEEVKEESDEANRVTDRTDEGQVDATNGADEIDDEV